MIHIAITAIAILTAASACPTMAKSHDSKPHATQAPLEIRFDQPTTLKGALPWYYGKPPGYDGKVPIGYRNAANIDPYWEQASLPVGNGMMGASIFGAIATERISLNEKLLWLGGPNTKKGAAYYWNVNKASAGKVKEIREAFARGDHRLASQLTSQNMNGVISYEPQDEKPFRFGTFTTLGELHIATGIDPTSITGYERVLSLDSAKARIAFTDSHTRTRYTRETFCSYPDNVMVMRFKADRKKQQNLQLTYHPNPLATGTCTPQGKDAICYKAALDNNGMKFCLLIKALVKSGTIDNRDGKLTISNADEAVFIVTAGTDYKMNFDPDFDDPETYVGNNPEPAAQKRLLTAAKMGYRKLLRRHLHDYMPLFGRVRLKLGGSNTATSHISTPERLRQYRQGKHDAYLESLYFQYGRYLLIASSRKGALPANLQGIWLNNINGPWHCDYHNNINIQMNYWPALTGNLAECMQPLTDYIKTQVKPGAVTAKSYYGARGWTSSISGNPFGFTAPLRDRNMQYNLCFAAGPWLATHLWEYYDYTRDTDWLRTEGYPIIKGAAQFACDFLWHKADSTYTAAPSTSPEHGDVDEGATFVHAVVRELLADAVKAAHLLNVDTEEAKQWQHVADHLVPYRIGRYGQLLEWSTDIDDPNDRHRHVNHLFGLHPGSHITPSATPQLTKAARIVLEHRGDGATGWSMGWKLNQWARLQDGNHAYKLYGNLLKNGTADNLWDMHPPFQIDGNFGGTAGIIEMLMQSHAGCIHLLPALPDAWSEGSVEGLMARGNFGIDIAWKQGKATKATITSHKGGNCIIRYGNSILEFPTKAGKQYTLTFGNNSQPVLQ